MRILQIVGEIVLLLTALFNIGLWTCNVFRLPKYVHGIAAVSFLLGCLLSYEVFLLGKSAASTLWFPFAFAALVYFLFVAHGVGMPSEKELKRATAEWKKAAEESEEDEQEPRIETRG